MGRGGLLSLPVSGETTSAPTEREGRGKEGKESSVTADSKTTTRHGPPAPPPSSSQVDVLCKKLLGKLALYSRSASVSFFILHKYS